MRAVFTGLLLALALPAAAQEFVAGAGATRVDAPPNSSFGLMLSYSHDLGEHLSGSLSYLNEGHVPSHHRDGNSAQLWLRANAFSPRLTLAVGIGPYRYFDTTVAEERPGFINAHGWATLYSVAATWRSVATPWFYELRVNRIEAPHGNPDATQILAGIGYRLQQDGSFRRNATTPAYIDHDDEVVLYAGETIVNSFESDITRSRARSVEYRRSFGPVVRAALAWLNEGDARLIRRNGVIAEAFLEPSFYGDRFTLGLGVGGYVAVDDYRGGTSHPLIMTLVTTTMSYHFARDWLARLTWHRIVSNYDRDSDIVLLGVGYRF